MKTIFVGTIRTRDIKFRKHLPSSVVVTRVFGDRKVYSRNDCRVAVDQQ